MTNTFCIAKIKVIRGIWSTSTLTLFFKEHHPETLSHVLPPTVEEVETSLNNDVNDLQQNQLNKQESLNITGPPLS